jgi:hypothetical protein
MPYDINTRIDQTKERLSKLKDSYLKIHHWRREKKKKNEEG